MTDKQWMSVIKRIKDPIEMLKVLVKEEHLLGYDPYYAELRKCLLDQAEKIANGSV